MTTLYKLGRILEICERYVENEATLAAEHDIIYLPITNETEISKVDTERLVELGAFKSDVDCWAVHT